MSTSLTAHAYAKINLTLEVLGRPDHYRGYHEVATVLQTVSLADELTFEKDERIELVGSVPGLPKEEDLVYRAAILLKKRSSYSGGARITVHKHIPAAGGLGGGSADAGATLVQLNQLWGAGMSKGQLAELGAELGSDVPFFIYGGTALAKGRGEKITTLPPLTRQWLVLAPVPITLENKTGRLYSLLEHNMFTDGRHSEALCKCLEAGQPFSPVLCFNVFDSVATRAYDGITQYMRALVDAGARGVHLAGSGPTLLAFVAGEAEAQQVCQRLGQGGIEGLAVQTTQ